MITTIGVESNSLVSRFGYINDQGVCIIGMKKIAMIPLISFDVVVNVSRASDRLFKLELTNDPRCT